MRKNDFDDIAESLNIQARKVVQIVGDTREAFGWNPLLISMSRGYAEIVESAKNVAVKYEAVAKHVSVLSKEYNRKHR